MEKTCNLSTVSNTPSEARRNTVSVVYYYINYIEDLNDDDMPRWHSLRAVIETIWDLFETAELTFLDGLCICAYMSDSTIRYVRYISVDTINRNIIISRL